MKLFGSLSMITFSPIVTIEPRRRKFHCPIKLKIPLPAGYRSDLSANLHLLCSITGGQNRAIWEDVTGSTPLSIQDDCLLFTTTVSARFWLIHCKQQQHCQQSTRFAQEIYRHLIAVPFMAKFVLFAKRRDINESNMRAFCMTDDKEERTLEVQEHYTQVAKSKEVEVLEGQQLFLEFGGNLMPTSPLSRGSGALTFKVSSSALINEQLSFQFHSFQENRLAFGVRVKDISQEASGRVAFMEDSIKYLASLNAQQRAYLAEKRRRALCTLSVLLPVMCINYDNILGTPKRNSYYASTRIGDLTLADIAQELETPPAGFLNANEDDNNSLASSKRTLDDDSLYTGSQLQQKQHCASWIELAPKLGIPRDEVEYISENCSANQQQQQQQKHRQLSPTLILLMHWFKLASPESRDQDLARALIAIGRRDIAQKLNFPIEAKKISRSTMELLREIELIPVRSTENLYGGGSASSDIGLAASTLDEQRHLAASKQRGLSLPRSSQAQQRQTQQIEPATPVRSTPVPEIRTQSESSLSADNLRASENEGEEEMKTRDEQQQSQMSRQETVISDEGAELLNKFAQNLTDQALEEALNELKSRKEEEEGEEEKEQKKRESSMLSADDEIAISSSSKQQMDNNSQVDWSQEEKSSILNVRVEQTTYLEPRVTRSSSSNAKKQRRRKVNFFPQNSSINKNKYFEDYGELARKNSGQSHGSEQEIEMLNEASAQNNKQTSRIKGQHTDETTDLKSNRGRNTGEATTSPPPPSERNQIHLAPECHGTVSAQTPSDESELVNCGDEWRLLENSASSSQSELEMGIRECSEAKNWQASELQQPGADIVVAACATAHSSSLRHQHKRPSGSNNPDPDSAAATTTITGTPPNDDSTILFDVSPGPQSSDSSDFSSIETNCSVTEEEEEPATVRLNVNNTAQAQSSVGLESAGSGLEFGGKGCARGAKGVEPAAADLDSGGCPLGERGWGCAQSSRVGPSGAEFKAAAQTAGGGGDRGSAICGSETSSGEKGAQGQNLDELDLEATAWKAKQQQSSGVEPKGGRKKEERSEGSELKEASEHCTFAGQRQRGRGQKHREKRPEFRCAQQKEKHEAKEEEEDKLTCAAAQLIASLGQLDQNTKEDNNNTPAIAQLEYSSNQSRTEKWPPLDELCSEQAFQGQSRSGTVSTVSSSSSGSSAAELGRGRSKSGDACAIEGAEIKGEKEGEASEGISNESELILTSSASTNELVGSIFGATQKEQNSCAHKRLSESSSGSNSSSFEKNSASEKDKIAGIGGDSLNKSTPTLPTLSNQQTTNATSNNDQSSSYTTAPLAPLHSSLCSPANSTNNLDFTTISSSSIYDTARSNLSSTQTSCAPEEEELLKLAACSSSTLNNEQEEEVTLNNDDQTDDEEEDEEVEEEKERTGQVEAEMVSFSIGEEPAHPRAETPPTSCLATSASALEISNNEDLDEGPLEFEGGSFEGECSNSNNSNKETTQGSSNSPSSSQISSNLCGRKFTSPTTGNESPLLMEEQYDEEQLRRLLACKRLSEGCNSRNPGPSIFTRKNSLHMIEELPPVTEGEPMKHMSANLHALSQHNIETSSGSSSSLRGVGTRPVALRELAMKRGSQDENTTSCSSSTSLNASGSPSRRRSSTVSQCSSVLSEGTRNQLNFDLSPDLAPESSLLEANACSPTDIYRPASPEPSSMSVSSLDFRQAEALMLQMPPSPDSTLGDSNDNESMLEHLKRLTQSYQDQQDAVPMEEEEAQMVECKSPLDPVEGLSEEVSTVLVSNSRASSAAENQDVPGNRSKSACGMGTPEVQTTTTTSSSRMTPSSKRSAEEDADNNNKGSRSIRADHQSDQCAGQKAKVRAACCARDGSLSMRHSPDLRQEAARGENPQRISGRSVSVGQNQPSRTVNSTPSPIEDDGRQIMMMSTDDNNRIQQQQQQVLSSANSLYSSSTNSSSSNTNTTVSSQSSLKTSQKRPTSRNKNPNEDARLLQVIKLEQKDNLKYMRQSSPSPNQSGTGSNNRFNRLKRRTELIGHRHSNQDSGPMCYCHNL